MIGIVFQWYWPVPLAIGFACMGSGFMVWLFFACLPISKQYLYRWVQGLFIALLFSGAGIILTFINNIHNNAQWFGQSYQASQTILVTIEEPFVAKKNSYKANASVTAIKINNAWQKTTGKIIVYLKRDSTKINLQYGSQIIINKNLQPITNSGNPGALDYARFCLFQGITHQVFLSGNEFVMLKHNNSKALQKMLFTTRDAAVHSLQEYIPGKKEKAVAEALLIGYRNDLDRDLVQAYSNTGVVHIIAISGLHLAMIYGLLNAFFNLFKRKQIRWIKPVVTLFVLWGFTLIAGAAPSIMRATVMFTAIVIGETFNRKTNMYNTLAASAFVLLLINPFYLWDVGFQLSYAAVLSIVIFMKPVYNWFYCKNKMLDAVWKLNAITLSAQVLTIPIILFHFHQFSTLFLIANFIAVPLSGLILYGELLLLCLSWCGFAAKITGSVVGFLLYLLNSFIENTDSLSFSVLDGLQVSIIQILMLYGSIILIAVFLFYKRKYALIGGLCFLSLFCIIRAMDITGHLHQQKIIVYNVPKHTAIDIVSGTSYSYIGDTEVLRDDFLRNFHLKPGRIQNRLSLNANLVLPAINNAILNFHGKKILLLNNTVPHQKPVSKIPVDIIIVSKNPRLNIPEMQDMFDCKEIVFDSSNPLWKIQQWKKDCNNLHLRFHSIPEQGALEMNL